MKKKASTGHVGGISPPGEVMEREDLWIEEKKNSYYVIQQLYIHFLIYKDVE